jgi:hypothetical protein
MGGMIGIHFLGNVTFILIYELAKIKIIVT